MHNILLSIFLISSFAFATKSPPKTKCILSQEGSVSVSWKAYKTPLKIGVGGVFDKAIYTPVAKEGKNFKEILVGSSIVIDKASVNSKNKGRDTKLVKFFFEMMKGVDIKAKIIGIKADSKETGKPKTGTLITEITMNQIVKTVPLKYTFDQGILTAQGTIDIFDFNANAALQALNIACFDKHQGKTWNDVSIGFTTHIKAICEP